MNKSEKPGKSGKGLDNERGEENGTQSNNCKAPRIQKKILGMISTNTEIEAPLPKAPEREHRLKIC